MRRESLTVPGGGMTHLLLTVLGVSGATSREAPRVIRLREWIIEAPRKTATVLDEGLRNHKLG